MTLALAALFAIGALWILSKAGVLRPAASAPAIVIAGGAFCSLMFRATDAPTAPADWIGAASEAGLAALVFAAAAQIRASRFLRRSPASFRLALGAAPVFLVVCALSAFVLVPQLSLPSALLLGAALMLNGAAFDRRAVTAAPAPAPVKAAVRLESAAIIAIGAPIAVLLTGAATAPGASETALRPLLDASVETFVGFFIGGAAGLVAARREAREANAYGGGAVIAGLLAFLVAALLGANAVIAAGAAGLIWGEETRTPSAARLRLRREIEESIPPAAYFLFGCALAPRVFEADLLSIIFALAAVTVLRAGPRLAILQSSKLPKESQVFLAWFGGAPGAASALFVLSLLDNAMVFDHESFLTVATLAVVAGIFAARLTARPLANAFLRQTALARKRRMYAG